MSPENRWQKLLISKLENSGSVEPLFIPDLRLWYRWHSDHDSLPFTSSDESLSDICSQIGVPEWKTVKPWNPESPGAEVENEQTDSEQRRSITVAGKTLTSSWTLGPDGDWWQAEYPAKSVEDLETVRNYVERRNFVPDLQAFSSVKSELAERGIVAIELPAEPFAWLMLEIIGWSEGLMLLMDAEEIVKSIIEISRKQIVSLVENLSASTSGEIFFSSDNLDGQFISPSYFDDFLAEGYRDVAGTVKKRGGFLLTHCGGPAGRLLGPLNEAGVSGVAGICAPPQGDTSLAEARERAKELALWGGIAQNYLLPTDSTEDLDRSIDDAISFSGTDPGVIIGIADHVPLEADPDRLRRIAERCGYG